MIESGLAKASSDFLMSEDDPLIITGRLFLCGWLVVPLNEGFPGRRSGSETRAHSRRRQAWNMRPAGEETRAAEVEPTWENGGFKLEKIVVNACLTLSVAVNLRCPSVTLVMK